MFLPRTWCSRAYFTFSSTYSEYSLVLLTQLYSNITKYLTRFRTQVQRTELDLSSSKTFACSQGRIFSHTCMQCRVLLHYVSVASLRPGCTSSCESIFLLRSLGYRICYVDGTHHSVLHGLHTSSRTKHCKGCSLRSRHSGDFGYQCGYVVFEREA